ncbi:glutathione S-transferase [Rhizorhabdus wittichii DC-6]|nr:glutathione S-transferase [Rhizorhabdus wittichii DC-6]
MKLHTNRTGANCRRVAIYLAEKGLAIEAVHLDLSSGELKTPAFRAINPAGLVPVLELDDGSYLPESTAIIEYLEELHPEPCLIGTTPRHRAHVRAIERIASDLGVLTIAAMQHTHPYFAARLKQEPSVGAALQGLLDQHLTTLERHIGDFPFLAGERLTIADIVLFPLFQTCRERMGIPFGAEQPRLSAWYDRFAKRPSAQY